MTFNLNTWIAVGEALAGNWGVGYLAGRDDAAVLLREDGLQIIASEGFVTPRGMNNVRLSVNGAEWAHKRYNETNPSINVNPGRTAESLARDIERRLIPAAEEFREVILDRVAQADEYRRGVEALRERLIATGAFAAPSKHDDDEDRLRLKPGVGLYGDVTNGDDFVKVEVSLSAEDAVEVFALLAERRAK